MPTHTTTSLKTLVSNFLDGLAYSGYITCRADYLSNTSAKLSFKHRQYPYTQANSAQVIKPDLIRVEALFNRCA